MTFCFSESKDGISRALDNIGRCHARLGHYAEAIDSWMEKLPLSKTPLETTWLHHEIGRCYLEEKSFQDALECGQRSLASAQEAKEQVWELNATVLIAQAQGKTIGMIGLLMIQWWLLKVLDACTKDDKLNAKRRRCWDYACDKRKDSFSLFCMKNFLKDSV